VGAN